MRDHKAQIASTLIALAALLVPLLLSAQVMQSSNYHIEFDSINTSGLRSTSANYVMEDTVGEVATGRSESTNYKIKAGYQQMNEVFLSLSTAQNVVMSPDLGGITGGVANGQTSATATTDGAAGYELLLKASSSPALQSALSSIPDYTPAGVDPDFTFVTPTGSSAFAYSPEGVDIASRFLDNGVSCNTGSGDTANACWDGLSTSSVVIAQRTSANQPNGSQTVIKFRTGIDNGANQLAGTYVATSTITLLAL